MGSLQTFHIEPPCCLGHYKDTLHSYFCPGDHCISLSRRTDIPCNPDTDNNGDRGCGVDGAESVGRRRRTDYAVVFKVNVWNENELFLFRVEMLLMERYNQS